MRKYVLGLILFFGLTSFVYAENEPAAAAPADTAATAPAADEEKVAAVETAPAAEAAAPAETATAADAPAAENLEFISGEVGAIDEAAKTVTIKLYGETDNTPGDKSITVSVEQSTDITDGEKDRTLKSLTNGTEVDVEYDPSSSKATYIFVY